MRLLRPLIVLLAATAACRVRADHKEPDVTVPAEWSAASERPGAAPAAAPPEQWWRVFGDPELDSLIERAVAANPDLAVAKARVLEARAFRDFTAGGLYPGVNAHGGVTRAQSSDNIAGPGSNRESFYDVGFDASWEVDLFGSNKSGVEAADAGVAAAEEDRRDALVTLLGEVAFEYIQLRGAQRQIVLTRANADAQRQTLELTRARAQAGLAPELDVTRAETQTATTEAVIPSFQSQVSASVHRLSVLIGEPPRHLSQELGEGDEQPRAVVAAQELAWGVPSDLLRRRPDIRRAERELAQAAALTDQATADLYPKFTLVGAIGHQSRTFSDLADADSLAWGVGGSFLAPLFQGGSLRAAVRFQDARQEQAVLRYRAIVLRSLAEVEDALATIARERERATILQVALGSSRRSLELAKDLHARGLADFFEVLDTQRAQLLTELEVTRSETVLATQAVALYKALGGGWESLEPGESAPGAAP